MTRNGHIDVTSSAGAHWHIEVSCLKEGEPFSGYPDLVIGNLNRMARLNHWIGSPFDYRFHLLAEASKVLQRSGCAPVVHWPRTDLDPEPRADEVW